MSEEKNPALEKAIEKAAKSWAEIEQAVQHGYRTLLWGPPGTGKSFAGTSNCAEISRLYLTMDTPAAEVRGHFVPTNSGGFAWHDGPGATAWRKGHRLVVDEIDAASGDTLTILLALLDDPESARVTLPSNETIVPKAGFSAVCTTNQSPGILPEALHDRFDSVVHVQYPNPAAFQPEHWSNPELCQIAKEIVYLTDNAAKTDSGRTIGVRALKSLDRFVGNGVPIEVAARLALGENAGERFAKAHAIRLSPATLKEATKKKVAA